MYSIEANAYFDSLDSTSYWNLHFLEKFIENLKLFHCFFDKLYWIMFWTIYQLLRWHSERRIDHMCWLWANYSKTQQFFLGSLPPYCYIFFEYLYPNAKDTKNAKIANKYKHIHCWVHFSYQWLSNEILYSILKLRNKMTHWITEIISWTEKLTQNIYKPFKNSFTSRDSIEIDFICDLRPSKNAWILVSLRFS